MAKGKAKVNYLGGSGMVMPQSSPYWAFIYEASLTKSSRYNVGDRVVLPDGREFIYGRASAVCASGQACEFVNTGFQAYTTPVKTTVIGDSEIEITGTTHDAIAKDELKGGFMVSWPAALKDTVRGIIGNDVAIADANFKIYLDGPLNEVHTAASTGLEIWANPYGELRTGSSASYGKAGVPATYVSTALMYFWVQRKGIGWLAPQSDVVTNHTGCYYRHDGSIESYIDFEDMAAGTNSSQYAGHRIAGDYDNNGPLFMLQG